MQRRSLLIALPAMAAACSGGDDVGDRQAVAFTTVLRNTYSGPTSTADPAVFGAPPYAGVKLFVIRSETELNYFWNAVQPAGAKSPLPTIDPKLQALVGVFAGAKPNTCYDVVISKATRDGNQVVVTYQEKIPSGFGGATCSPAGVYPFALAVLDLAPTEQVAFEEGPKIIAA
jgi:hypothetical protein